MTNVLQSETSTENALPFDPEITTSYKQPSDEPSAVSTNVNNPLPAGITSPLKTKT